MAQLAIKGHATRGGEVIEILEMLGGKNLYNYSADCDGLCFYIGKEAKIIYHDYVNNYEDILVFTLEKFLERYPYKIGDKVLINDDINDVYTIKSMIWDTDIERVAYRIEAIVGIMDNHHWFADEMERYLEQKEETIENKLDLLQQLKDYFDNTPREVVEKEWHEYKKYNEIGPTVDEYLEYVNKIRQPKYPTTYKECCEVLAGRKPNPNEISFDKMGLCLVDLDDTQNIDFQTPQLFQLNDLFKLLMCRNAYWKIAGEQMGLGGPWKYDMSKDEFSYAISYQYGRIQKNEIRHKNAIFAFPTAEMRDAFKENFDDDIEFCKEFL